MKDRTRSTIRRTTNTTNSTMIMTPITSPPISPELMLLLCCSITTMLLIVEGKVVGMVVSGAEDTLVSREGVVGSTSREQMAATGESS